MGWPKLDDAHLRRRYIASVLAETVSNDAGLLHTEGDLVGALNRVCSGQAKPRPFQWTLPLGPLGAAGAILRIMRSVAVHHADIRGGSSVNKAIYLLGCRGLSDLRCPCCGKALIVNPKNRRDLYRAWAVYKGVSHLAANTGWRESYDSVGLGTLLRHAQNYQQWATGFRPATTKSTLLDPDAIWRVPEHLTLPDLDIQIEPLRAEELEIIQGYRAPI
jgi:hypothetical protein